MVCIFEWHTVAGMFADVIQMAGGLQVPPVTVIVYNIVDLK